MTDFDAKSKILNQIAHDLNLKFYRDPNRYGGHYVGKLSEGNEGILHQSTLFTNEELGQQFINGKFRGSVSGVGGYSLNLWGSSGYVNAPNVLP